jgi:hypothetical protein
MVGLEIDVRRAHRCLKLGCNISRDGGAAESGPPLECGSGLWQPQAHLEVIGAALQGDAAVVGAATLALQ